MVSLLSCGLLHNLARVDAHVESVAAVGGFELAASVMRRHGQQGPAVVCALSLLTCLVRLGQP